MKFKLFLTENPDKLIHGNVRAGWNQSDAYPFGYIGGKFLISKKPGIIHVDMIVDAINNKDISVNDIKGFKGEVSRDHMNFPGRLWKERKVMSFWEYPSKEELDKIKSDMKENGFTISNDWKIETSDGKKLISIKDYEDSDGENEVKRTDHALSPMLKQKNTNIKPKKIDLPKGMTVAQHHDKKEKDREAGKGDKKEDKPELYKSMVAKRRGLTYSGWGVWKDSSGNSYRWEDDVGFKKIIKEDVSISAPDSPADGQFEKKFGSVVKRNVDLNGDEVDDILSKFKKSLSKLFKKT